MSKKILTTGERLETTVFNETSIEHLHRYAVAMELAKDKKVLDIACGEGYGTNLLSSVASHVTGVDIDNATIEKAKNKYISGNIDFLNGSILQIPLSDKQFDFIACFETLEHIDDHKLLLQELKRVLNPGGIIAISTPDKKNYSDKTGYNNPFHIKELYLNDFEILLNESFKEVEIYQQLSTFTSLIQNNEQQKFNLYLGNFDKIEKNKTQEPLYFFAIVSDNPLPSLINSLFMGTTIVQKVGNVIIENALAEKEKMITSTITYRLGHFILYPFKIIQAFFNKMGK